LQSVKRRKRNEILSEKLIFFIDIRAVSIILRVVNQTGGIIGILAK
jgi:hypothetical protein